jgi:hypothetical protein
MTFASISEAGRGVKGFGYWFSFSQELLSAGNADVPSALSAKRERIIANCQKH